MTALCYNVSDVRPKFRGSPFAWYQVGFKMLSSLLLTLRLVQTTLPIHTMVTARLPSYEAALRRLGSTVLPIDTRRVIVPRWASEMHRGTFAKLLLLELTQFERIIFLDSDCQVVRNIDHLAAAPAPSLAFHRKDDGPNSGVMVLAPNASEGRRMQRLLLSVMERRPRNGNGQDGSDQTVWNAFFGLEPGSFVHELPVGYNYRPIWTMRTQEELCKIHIWHTLDALGGIDGKPDVSRGLYVDRCFLQGETSLLVNGETGEAQATAN